ncbi:MAG: 1-acyl-sn-glycerol-3-phosphate acyltransferase, partial [Planctomycetes bacterium]|nr:1-acyl-sn-glycerol-3-phosphate acyltransferase [Planctomycetota bacterium]
MNLIFSSQSLAIIPQGTAILIGHGALASFTIPKGFKCLFYSGKYRRQVPVTLLSYLMSLGTFLIFLIGCFLLTFCLPFFTILPGDRIAKKKIFHNMIHLFSRFIVFINIPLKKTIINLELLDFTKPAVLIANHQSHLDLVLILMLNPKVIVLTNQWVWNNPFYGLVVRYAEYYPIYQGLEGSLPKLQKKVNDGYSILIFPEGSRTPDGSIKRFH